MNKIIFFELNEVPMRIFEYYMKMRPLSWLAIHYDQLKKYETFSENPGNLSPWNTWPTLHRGVSSEQHQILNFNQDLDGVDKEFPPIWRILAKEDIKVGVFGSLHSYPIPFEANNYDFYVPDVFASSPECIPQKIELFQEINLKLSRKSARNVDKSVPFKHMVKLMANVPALGLKAGTIKDVGGQLISERMNKWKGVRRRTFQSVISFDIFYKQLSKHKPDFVTFYTNHVASSLHRYWAATFPHDYDEMKYEQQWIERYSNEILFTMDKADEMLRKLANFVDKHPEYKLVVTSSMGQDAVECNPIESQTYIVDHEKFMKVFGIEKDDFRVTPAMRPQFNYVVLEDKLAAFTAQINKTVINGKPLSYRLSDKGRVSFDMGHRNFDKIQMTVNGEQIPADATGLENVKIEDRSSSTALHVPEGHLFVYHPNQRPTAMNQHQVETCDIAPALLLNFGIQPEDYMNRGNVKLF